MSLLPSFDAPPVSEVVMSLDMARIAGWGIPHFGLFWQGIREEFPTFQVVPGAEPELEDFASQPPVPPQVIEFKFEQDPNAIRCWFITNDGTELIQVQRNRFVQNWRKQTGDEIYPRYADHLRRNFHRRYQRFVDFLATQNLAGPDVAQIEITYINEIEPGQGWATAGELSRVIAPWSGEFSEGFLPPPYGTRISASFAIPKGRGRLHVNMQRAIRPRDRKEILQLRLVARVKPTDSGVDAILDAFDIGRDWIVRGFTDWTTPQMHKIWKRVQ
jgi:uncharacterized protein (TIGR04255 family)